MELVNFSGTIKRKLIQFFSLILYNSYIPGFLNGKIYRGPLKGVCAPGLNCHSCPGALGACPIGSLQNGLSFLRFKIPFYVIGTLMLFGVIFGRLICGFLCPFGLIQDLLYKIPSPKFKKNKFTRILSYSKYFILAIFVIAIPILLHKTPFCRLLCPVGILEGTFFLLPTNPNLTQFLGPLFLFKLTILILVLVISIVHLRPFCRYICPLGAIYALFSRWAIFGIKIDSKKCNNCNKCVRFCLLDIKEVGDGECIQCGDCISRCPQNAISIEKRY